MEAYEVHALVYQELDRYRSTQHWLAVDRYRSTQHWLAVTLTFSIQGHKTMEVHKVDYRKDREDWNAVNEMLASTFRSAAAYAYKCGEFSAEEKHKYFKSVTESEVEEGLLNVDNADEGALCFIREISDINTQDKKASRYKDMEGGHVDEEAVEWQDDLKKVKVPRSLSKDNIKNYQTPWSPEGIDRSLSQHDDYLKQLVTDYLCLMKGMIDNCLTRDKTSDNQELYDEVLHHSHFTVYKCQNFCGRKDVLSQISSKLFIIYKIETVEKAMEMLDEDDDITKEDRGNIKNELEKMKEYAKSTDVKFAAEEEEMTASEQMLKELNNPVCEQHNKPLVVYGPSGSGKTAIMAMVSKLIPDWLKKEPVKIIRFLGTSANSTNVRDTLLNICQQIWEVYKIDRPLDIDIGADFSYLILYFNALLWKIEANDLCETPLVIILDSVDQLSSKDYSYEMYWVPQVIPENVYIIISVLPQTHNCLEKMRKLQPDESRYVEVPVLPRNTAEEILRTYLKNANRTLTEKQFTYVLSHYEKAPQPLFMKLVFEEAKLWKSYTTVDDCILGDTVREAIFNLFEKLEMQHGAVLVSRALGYMSVAFSGLNDTEMEDILSLDDAVLQDTYLHHLPPDELEVRLPPSLWKRLKYDLEEYISEKRSGNKMVSNWYHRQFVEAAKARYVDGGAKSGLHSVLADYFRGIWNNKVKPLDLYKIKKGSYPNATRGVPKQPIVFGEGVFNLRKMIELPYHLAMSGQLQVYKEEICKNFEWLYYKTKCMSFNEVLSDFRMLLDILENNDVPERDSDCREVKKLFDLLNLASDAVRKDTNNLPLQILGQIGPGEHTSDSKLYKDAAKFCEKSGIFLLTPSSRCLPAGGGDLRLSIDVTISYLGDSHEVEQKACSTSDGSILYVIDRSKQGDLLKKYDLKSSATLMETKHLKQDIKLMQLVGNDKYMYLEIYTKRDKFDPKYKVLLFNLQTSKPLALPPGTQDLFFSFDGRFALASLKVKQAKKQESDEKCGPSDAEEYTDDKIIKKKSEKKTKEKALVGIIIELETGERHCKIWHPENAMIHKAVFSFSSQYLLITFSMFRKDKQEIWDTNSGKFICTVPEEVSISYNGETKVEYVVVPNDCILITGMEYNSRMNVYLKNMKTGEVLKEYKGNDYQVSQICITSDYKKFLTLTKEGVIVNGNMNKAIYIFDIATGKILNRIPNGEKIFACCAFAGRENEYVITSEDRNGVLVVWYLGTAGQPLETGIPIYQIIGHNKHSMCILPSYSTMSLVSVSLDNTIKLWDFKRIMSNCSKIVEKHSEENELKQISGITHDKPYKQGEGPIETSCIAVTSDGKKGAVGTRDGMIIFYDFTSMTSPCHTKRYCHSSEVTKIISSQNGKYFISIANNSYAKVWSTELVDGLTRPLYELKVDQAASCLAEANNVLVVGQGGMECYGHLFDLNTGDRKGKRLEGLYGFQQVAITSDATRVSRFFSCGELMPWPVLVQ